MVSRAYASFAVLVPLLRWLLIIKLLMWCLNLLILKLQNKIGSFKVAHRIESVNVVEFIGEEFEKRPFDFLCDLMKF